MTKDLSVAGPSLATVLLRVARAHDIAGIRNWTTARVLTHVLIF